MTELRSWRLVYPERPWTHEGNRHLRHDMRRQAEIAFAQGFLAVVREVRVPPLTRDVQVVAQPIVEHQGNRIGSIIFAPSVQSCLEALVSVRVFQRADQVRRVTLCAPALGDTYALVLIISEMPEEPT